jgi:hypothetical protein
VCEAKKKKMKRRARGKGIESMDAIRTSHTRHSTHSPFSDDFSFLAQPTLRDIDTEGFFPARDLFAIHLRA